MSNNMTELKPDVDGSDLDPVGVSVELSEQSEHPIVASIRNVTVTFPDPNSGEDKNVIRNVSLDIRQGELVVLIGRSGCGKTTLLNLFAGLVEASAGTVETLGMSPHEARHRLGYMFARDALLPWRRALGNVEYGMELHGLKNRKERRARALDFLDKVHLSSAARLWSWQLSQGMRQRVALARTWAMDPDLLLMDEPFAALDAQTRMSVQAEFLQVWEAAAKAVVFVTHDLTEAIDLADRIILIRDGEVAEDIAVPFPRPRTPELSTTAEFQKLRKHLLEQIL